MDDPTREDDPLRFVIQAHDREGDPHFDIMLERDGRLRTWSAPRPPEEGVQQARSLPDHRMEYLTYEGEISGGRGSVRIWDRGTYRAETWEADRVVADLSGDRCRGRISLVCTAGDRWNLTWQDR